MVNLQDFSSSVYKQTKEKAKEDKYSIDIITILAIANIIVQIIRLLYSIYGSNNQVSKNLNKMGPITKFILWRYIRKEIKCKTERKYLLNSLKDSFSKLDMESINKLVNEQVGEKNG